MSHPAKTTSFKSASGTKSLISGVLLSVRLPSRMVPICVSEPIGLASPRRTASTPAIIVVATAPKPTTITPSFPVAGSILFAAFWPPCSSVPIVSPKCFDGSEFPGRSSQIQSTTALRGLHLPGAPQMRPHKPQQASQQRDLYRQMEAMEPLLKARVRIPCIAQPHACISQAKIPDPCTYRGINVKTHSWHPCNTRRKGDKRLHHRHHPRQQHRNRSVLFKKPGHAVQIVVAHQHPLAVAHHQRRPPLAPSQYENAEPRLQPT